MIVALCVLGGIGWLMISEKEEYLVQRNFRLLKLWSQDLSSKIEGYQQVFRFSAKGILEEFHDKVEFGELKKDQVNRRRFLRTYQVHEKDSQTKETIDLEQNILLSIMAIIIGFGLLIWGAERFVHGASAIAKT